MHLFLSLVQVGLIGAFVVLYVRIALGRGAVGHCLDVWRQAPQRPTTLLVGAIWLGVLLIDLIQTRGDSELGALLGLGENGFTSYVYWLEGDAVGRLQALLAWPPLTVVMTLAYLILFPALLFASFHVYDRLGDLTRLRMAAYVYALNYFICLPFYVFFPVNEPIFFSKAFVTPLMDEHLIPHLINIVRPMSGVDNCLPSYHTSLTVSLVWLAWGGRSRAYAIAASATGGLILLSTLYLGFHWLVDVAAGVAAGAVAVALARRLAEATTVGIPAPEVTPLGPGGPRARERGAPPFSRD